MGFYPIPPVPAYGSNCLIAFPPGQTPLELLVAFNGIEYNEEYWPPGVPHPPETWILHQAAGYPCEWYASDFYFYVSVAYSDGPYTSVALNLQSYESLFYGGVSGIKFGVANQNESNDPPAYLGWKGSCAITPKSGPTGPSLQNICTAVGLPIDINTKMDPIAESATHFGCHFHRRKDNVEFLAKFAFADFP